MKMTLRIEGYWVDLASAGFTHLGKKFHDDLPDIICRAESEDEDDSFDLDIECLDDLHKYMDAFRDFAMMIFVGEDSEYLSADYTLCNKKIRYNDGKYVSSRVEIKREAVSKDLIERINRAVKNLTGDMIDFGDGEEDKTE